MVFLGLLRIGQGFPPTLLLLLSEKPAELKAEHESHSSNMSLEL